MRSLISSSLLALPLLCFSCSGNLPERSARSLALPANYASVRDGNLELTPSLLGLFSDENLSRTVRLALSHNPDLKVAQSQLSEAGFNLKKTRSGLFPEIAASGSANRNQRASNSNTFGGGQITNSFSADLDASWEVDVWGRIRSGVSASSADHAAVAADYDDARQSLAAQTMQAWFTLVAAEKSLDLDQRRVASFSKTTKLVNRRFEVGQGNLADLELARTDLSNAEADVQASRDERDQAARRIQILTGRAPDAKVAAQHWPSLHRSVPAGLPSDLLRKRPDVVAAYARIRAADALVKVAHADLFPSFVLTASGGRNSETLSDLARSSFDTWSLLANFSAPIFDAGQRRAELGAAGQRAEQAFLRYQSTVLQALEEVENALGSENYLAREESRRLAALDAARRATALTQRNYEAGTDDLLTLLEAQRRVFTTEQNTINLRASRLSNRVALALALGKGV